MFAKKYNLKDHLQEIAVVFGKDSFKQIELYAQGNLSLE